MDLDRPLGDALRAKVRRLFPPADVEAAERMLEARCGRGLPFSESLGAKGVERVRCAAVKRSGGSLARLESAVRDAARDWRDVLLGAGFAHDPLAHHAWLAENVVE